MNSPSSPGVRGDAPTAVQEALAAALALHRQGKRELAMQRYVTILQQDPKNLDALYYVAALALQEGQTDEGIRVIRRALDIGPPQARLHNLLGQAQLRKNQDEEALKSFGSAIECDTAFVDAYGNRATLLGCSELPLPRNSYQGLAKNRERTYPPQPCPAPSKRKDRDKHYATPPRAVWFVMASW